MPNTKSISISLHQRVPGVTSSGRNITTIFEEENDFCAWEKVGDLPTLVLVDKKVLNFHATSMALRSAGDERQVYIESIQGGEHVKQSTCYQQIRSRYQTLCPCHVILVGSGALINLGLYLAAEMAPGCDSNGPGYCSIIPTNTMAIADVALGGLGMLNDNDGRKNVFRRQRDPDWIFLFSEYILNSSDELRRDGIVEVLKHAILQDKFSIDRLACLYLSDSVDGTDCYAAARQGLQWKSGLLRMMGTFENDDIEFLLSYGHLHAHVIEEIWAGSVAHSTCVFIGILIDLTLSEQVDLASSLIDAARKSPLRDKFQRLLSKRFIGEYLKSYPVTGRFFVDNDAYLITNVTADNVGNIVNANGISFTKLVKSIHEIRSAYMYLRQCFSVVIH